MPPIRICNKVGKGTRFARALSPTSWLPGEVRQGDASEFVPLFCSVKGRSGYQLGGIQVAGHRTNDLPLNVLVLVQVLSSGLNRRVPQNTLDDVQRYFPFHQPGGQRVPLGVGVLWIMRWISLLEL